jgi:cytochrome oxidase assembly protein ShyY1
MKHQIMGVHAPPSRPTIWAAALLACTLSLIFLAGLGLWQLLG